MTLSEYLSKNKKITNSSFAKHLGVTAQSISNYCNGKRIPEKKIMAKIAEITGGQVTADSFYLEVKNDPRS